ncbi:MULTISPECIES: LysE family translocator [Pseudoalteromonas]|uniref:Lysine transporter LysE n=1 Tax=Pseudoalteromonas amylolytica TaxID=1859457 RepID=A0A1S1MZC1_9GAMM|nr:MULTISPECIES: LysE family translocator [Pseudoalteromonas]OHU88074.1 lysine transporter LysE [Pseudoalteromonas sp. JW3]OHU91514.1 lysine transporter LysE [Pseudoalteromonas amylolytica]
MEYLFAVMLFAISSSITPGPNNVLVMTSGVNFGLRKSIPLLFGICIGFTIMLFLVGVGFMQVFALYPQLNLGIKIVGVAYLLYLAVLIAKSATSYNTEQQGSPLTFLNGALYQWVNAKAWMVASGAIAAFTTVGTADLEQNMQISVVFLLVSFPCVGTWLVFGTVLKKYLAKRSYRQWFNYTMALLLVLSVLPVLFEIANMLGSLGGL